jgi:hypothetical protein
VALALIVRLGAFQRVELHHLRPQYVAILEGSACEGKCRQPWQVGLRNPSSLRQDTETANRENRI